MRPYRHAPEHFTRGPEEYKRAAAELSLVRHFRHYFNSNTPSVNTSLSLQRKSALIQSCVRLVAVWPLLGPMLGSR
jgi:hypothetical protein